MEETSGSLSQETIVETPKTTVRPKQKVVIITDPRFRLNVYTPSGNVRQSIPVEMYRDACVRYGDIMRAISSTRWMTMDEVCQATWDIEKRLKHPSNRTRKVIESAVTDLVERSLVVVK